MERFRRGIAFWVLLFVACVFTASPMQAQQKKKWIFKAQMKIGANPAGVGASILQATNAGYDVMAFTNESAALFYAVTKVDLSIGDGREIILCMNGDPIYDDCTWDDIGSLDLTTAIGGPNFALSGISGIEFRNALVAGQVLIQLNDGVFGEGYYSFLV